MKGTVISKDDALYVEYSEGKQIRLAFYDPQKIKVGETIEFECKSYETISGEELATIK